MDSYLFQILVDQLKRKMGGRPNSKWYYKNYKKQVDFRHASKIKYVTS